MSPLSGDYNPSPVRFLTSDSQSPDKNPEGVSPTDSGMDEMRRWDLKGSRKLPGQHGTGEPVPTAGRHSSVRVLHRPQQHPGDMGQGVECLVGTILPAGRVMQIHVLKRAPEGVLLSRPAPVAVHWFRQGRSFLGVEVGC